MPTVLRLLLTIVPLLLACCAGVAQDAPQEPAMSRKPAVVRLPWHIYRHYPADFSRWREAAAGFKGWESEVRDLDLSKTCLALMHFPDTGLTPDTTFSPDCPNPNALGTIEWIPRTMDVVQFRMPPLLRAARAAGLQVAHVGVSGPPYTEGPIWEQCLKEAGAPPPPEADAIAKDPAVVAQHTRDVFDLPRPQPANVPPHVFSLPPEFLPQGSDVIAQHPWQLHRLLQERGITHIVYCGWALNWCLWFSPCGMSDMDRKGYLCSAVRGGCVAIENRESAVGEKNLEYAYWKTCTMWGYIFDLHELTTALRQKTAPKGD